MKNLTDKNSWLFLVLKIIKNRKNKKMIESFFQIENNPNLVLLERNSKEQNRNILCDLYVGGPNDGFFALVRWALDGLYFCDYYGFKAVIRFPENSLYKDHEMSNNLNPFDYFFEQPFAHTFEDLEQVQTVINYSGRNRLCAESLNGGLSYRFSDKYVEELAKIMTKYLKFNSETNKKMAEDLVLKNIPKNTLGVHIRGTDYKGNYKNHPTYIKVEEYYDFIDKAIEKYSFEKIFLATDDAEILKKFIEHYGEQKIIYAKNVLRGSGHKGVHCTNNDRKYHRYLLGLEVIFDMNALSSCSGIISSMSQVGLISRIYKKSKGENFIYDKIINKGINKSGKIFKK